MVGLDKLIVFQRNFEVGAVDKLLFMFILFFPHYVTADFRCTVDL